MDNVKIGQRKKLRLKESLPIAFVKSKISEEWNL